MQKGTVMTAHVTVVLRRGEPPQIVALAGLLKL